MPTRFLTDEQLAAYGRYAAGPLDQAVLERFFFLDDTDRDLVAKRRGDHNRLGFALQLVTVRHVGAFLGDPLDVPLVVLDYVAAQLGVADLSCVKRYTERDKTRLEHQWEIAEVHGFASFASAEAALVQWLDDEAWTTGDGPRALFYAAVAWLREGKVLLPGVTTLVELVATVRQGAEDRLYDTLATSVTAGQARSLETILQVPEGRRRSQLDLWRRGERSTTGRGMVLALDRVAEIAGLRMREADIASVPTRRVIELARYGIAAKAPDLSRHPYRRKIATLLATVRWLEVTAADDALELFDVFMSSELIGRANKGGGQGEAASPGWLRPSRRVLRAAVEVLFEAAEWSENVSLEAVWEAIDNAVGSRARLRAAVEGVQEFIPPPGADPDGQWRATVVERYATVRGFVKMLCRVIEFGATADAQKVLTAMRGLPGLLDARPAVRVPKDYLDARRVNVDLVPGGWWQRLVFPKGRPDLGHQPAGGVVPGRRRELPAGRQLPAPPGEQPPDLLGGRRDPQPGLLPAAGPVHLIDRALGNPAGHLVDLGLVPHPWNAKYVFSACARDSRVPLAAPRSTLPKYTSASAGSISQSGRPNQFLFSRFASSQHHKAHRSVAALIVSFFGYGSGGLR